jgi:Tol biopolymer transport system component
VTTGIKEPDSLCKNLPHFSRSDHVGSGGFSDIYQHPDADDQFVKVLKTPLTGGDADRVLRLVAVADWARPSDLSRLLSRFAWPLECYGENESIQGFSMPKAPNNCWFNLQAAGTRSVKLLQLKFLTNAAYWEGNAVQSSPPPFSDKQRRELAIEVFDAVTALHENGLIFGDVSSNNIAASQDAVPHAFFLDADSIGLPNEVERGNVKTPDWEPSENLDPFGRDISLVALLAWRLFTQASTAYPTIALSTLPAETQERLEKIRNVYRSGLASGLEELSRLLRSQRTTEEAQKAIDVALRTRFARNVLREANGIVHPGYEEIIEAAQEQVKYEESVDSASRKVRLKITGERRVSGSQFDLDVLPMSSASLAPRTVEELRDMIFGAQFEELASYVADGRLSTFVKDTWIPGALRHALLHIAVPPISASNKPGRTTIKWEWPTERFVNAANIHIRAAGYDDVKEVIYRHPEDRFGFAEINCDAGMKGQLLLNLAVQAPSDQVFRGASNTKSEFVVLPVPRPRQPEEDLAFGDETAMRAPVQMVDPVIEAAKREARRVEILKYRRRKAGLLAGVASLVLLAGWFAWEMISPEPYSRGIIFVSDRDENWEIYKTGTKFGEEIRLTENNFVDLNPQWSPSGDFIVFESFRDGDWEIMRMNADGSDVGPFTVNEVPDRYPAWSAAEDFIVFASHRDGDWDIFVTGQGGEDKQLTFNDFDDRNPQWSPSGDFIVFESFRDGDWEIMRMNADGSDVGPVTVNEVPDRYPAWSAAEDFIVFASHRDGDWDIFVTGQGGEDKQLTFNDFDDRNPQWSPDGDFIVFESWHDGNWEIMRINFEESTQPATFEAYTQNPDNDRMPSWKPAK